MNLSLQCLRSRVVLCVLMVSFFLALSALGPSAGDAAQDYLYLGANPDFAVNLLRPAPADGDTIYNDPPGFHWQPEEGSLAFVLEVSRDPTFPESDRLLAKAKESGPLVPASNTSTPTVVRGDFTWLVAGLPLSLHRPSFGLGSGFWFWRWRCVFAEGRVSPPSAPRRFMIPAGAVSFIVPPIQDLLSRIPDRHPRLFVRPEALDSLRRLKDSSEPYRKLWKRIEAYADTLRMLPIMKEPPPYPPGKGFNYELWRKYYDQARDMGQVLDFLGFCHLMTGESKWSDRAREWLNALVRWDVNGTSSMSSDDEVAMPILLNGARAYDWIYDKLSPGEREAIRKMLLIRGEQAYQRWLRAPYHLKPFDSHPTRLVNYMTQVATVLYGEGEEPDKWFGYVLPMATTFYPPWGGRDGGYSEGPSYWLMYFNYMLQSAYCLETALGLDILKTPFYRNDGYYKIYADPYFARLHPFADTGIGSYWPANKLNLYRLATVFHNPYFRWRAEMSEPKEMPVSETVVPSGVMSFFWLDEGPDRPRPSPPVDLPKSRLFRDIGLAAFHEDPSDPNETYLLLKSSPYGTLGHIYADQNAFYLQAFGEALAIQSGYYPWYGNPHHQKWTNETRAHNSVLVDGVGQNARDRSAKGRILAFITGSGAPGSLDYATADASGTYGGRLTKFIRHVYYQRPHDFLMIDELEAPKEVRFDWLLHSLEKMEVDQAHNTVTVRRGKARLTVKFLEPEKLTFSQTGKFAVEPGPGFPDQWHLTVSTVEKKKAVVFQVKMRVWQAK